MKLKKEIQNRISAVSRIIRRNFGKIAYYTGVLAVLCAVAYAAEIYRSNDPVRDGELILPAVEMETPAQTPEPNPFLLPEGAVCIRGFSAGPEWNGELTQWESHPAVDYTFENGEVPCLRAGRVVSIGESGIHGGFVELDCGDVLMRYASIEPSEEIEANMELKAGDSIGRVSGSMLSEGMLPDHLHLEIRRDGEAVDLRSLL